MMIDPEEDVLERREAAENVGRQPPDAVASEVERDDGGQFYKHERPKKRDLVAGKVQLNDAAGKAEVAETAHGDFGDQIVVQKKAEVADRWNIAVLGLAGQARPLSDGW